MNTNTELAIRLCEEMDIPFSSGTGRITIGGNDVTDSDFSDIFSFDILSRLKQREDVECPAT